MAQRKVQLYFKGRIEDFSKEKSVSYWQGLTGEERLAAGWEMVEDYWRLKGKDPLELRLNRTVALLKRPQG